MIYVVNRRRKLEKVKKEYPNAIILDVTSKSNFRYAQILSPFYPHENIPIPFSPSTITATCVEAVWQGLKVFPLADVDFSTFENRSMKNLKRTVRKFGKPLGHRKGVYGTELLNYLDARKLIYLPTYKWVLDNVAEVNDVINRIKEQSLIQDIVLLDYNKNIDIEDISKPLSHAGLIKHYIENNYPNDNSNDTPPTTDKPSEKKTGEHQVKKGYTQGELF